MTIYTNLNIFTMDEKNTWYKSGYIKVDGDKIIEIGDMKDCNEITKLGCDEKCYHGEIVIPGMVTTHSHFYGQFARGMSLLEPVRNWQQMLSRMWWKMDKLLTDEQNYYSAMMGLIEGLKAGTTCYFDHQASTNSTSGCLDLLEKAVLETGARACLSYEVSDRDGLYHRQSGIDENVRFIKKCKKQPNNRIKALFGLHASYSLSEDTLERASALGKELDCGFHIHVAEDQADVADSYQRFDIHPVERLTKAGILGGAIAAHCVHMGPEEWEIMKETGTIVAHNVRSNTNNAVGVCPVVKMMDAGVRVTLGGDGYTYDSFDELSSAILMQHLREKDPRAFNYQQIKDFTYGGAAKLSHNVFGKKLGSLETGAFADFVVLCYNEPTPVTKDNIFAHMTCGFSGHVKDVIVAGELTVKDGVCTMIDEEKILSECKTQAQKLWNRLG